MTNENIVFKLMGSLIVFSILGLFAFALALRFFPQECNQLCQHKGMKGDWTYTGGCCCIGDDGSERLKCSP